MVNNRSMTEFYHDTANKTSKEKEEKISSGKVVLIMDEVDGMSGGDRGGSAELAALIRKTKVRMTMKMIYSLLTSSFYYRSQWYAFVTILDLTRSNHSWTSALKPNTNGEINILLSIPFTDIWAIIVAHQQLNYDHGLWQSPTGRFKMHGWKYAF